MTRLTNKEMQTRAIEMLKQKAKEKNDVDFNQSTEAFEQNKILLDQHYDEVFLKTLTNDLFEIINDVWFRPVFVGFDNLPQRNNPQRPLIFASNHSGMAFPWDAMVFTYGLNKKLNFGKDCFKVLASPMLSFSSFMNPFQIKNLWKRAGAVDATFLNFESLMYQDKNHVMIYPEGVPGIGKGFDKRYQLQEYKSSFVRMSVKYRTEIYPIHTVNGEYIDPLTYSNKWLNRMMNYMGIPFLPLGPITLLLFLQPWVFYIAFPAKLTFVMGKGIRPFDWTNKPYEDITQEEFRQMADKVRNMAQDELNEAVKTYGKAPFSIKELLKKMAQNWKRIPHILPFNWPIIFTEFERRYRNGERDFHVKTGGLHILWYLFRNPITLFFFLPLIGWIPMIIRGFKNSNFPKKSRSELIIK